MKETQGRPKREALFDLTEPSAGRSDLTIATEWHEEFMQALSLPRRRFCTQQRALHLRRHELDAEFRLTMRGAE